MRDFVYDLETYPNIFTCAIREAYTDNRWLFEISDRMNQAVELYNFLLVLMDKDNYRMVGFNNIGFDYPILHLFMQNHSITTTAMLYDKAQKIIDSNKFPNQRWVHQVWESEHFIQQVDLFKIHHFDNRAKSTSLKLLEFNMRSDNIKDLPYAPGSILPDNAKDELRFYNMHDVDCTHQFLLESKAEIEFREELVEKYGSKWINFNDKKIGTQYFIDKLEAASPGSCYEYVDKKKKTRKTVRDYIQLGSVLFDYINFERPEFQRIHNYFKKTTITETKKDGLGELTCVVNGFKYDFGVGGLHGSIESATVVSDEQNVIIDLDVTSYYPSLGIVNRQKPAHHGEVFCDIYQEVKDQRLQYKKGTPENLMLKLALNGVFGDSNSEWSPFMDPTYTMTITINGQLLLCMLAEQMIKINGLKIIQANTDGITFKVPRNYLPYVQQIKEWWEKLTGLELEEAQYNRMFIRDVNNYVAEYDDGKLKRKGAYEYDLEWHQNFSALVVPKAAEAALVRGEDIRTFITNHTDIHDFMLRAKVDRTDKLMVSKPCRFYWHPSLNIYTLWPQGDGWEDVTYGMKKHIKAAHDQGVDAYVDEEVQRISRYYIANKGGELFKIMPPLKGKSLPRRMAQCKGWQVRICNDIKDAEPWDINYDYYIEETEKLVTPLQGV